MRSVEEIKAAAKKTWPMEMEVHPGGFFVKPAVEVLHTPSGRIVHAVIVMDKTGGWKAETVYTTELRVYYPVSQFEFPRNEAPRN